MAYEDYYYITGNRIYYTGEPARVTLDSWDAIRYSVRSFAGQDVESKEPLDASLVIEDILDAEVVG